MHELPEVETVVQTLRPLIIGRKVEEIEVLMPKMVKLCSINQLKTEIIGQKIKDIYRSGKYFIIVFEKWWIVGHLRMTGRLTLAKNTEMRDKYTHVVFWLDNQTQLRFADMRQFGCLYLVVPEEVDKIFGLATLGPEPLAEDLSVELFNKRIENKKVKIKQLLLNQQFVAGIGNIYADEILFHAGINPNRLANSLNTDEIERLYQSMRHIIAAGIRHRGTSIKDYVDGFGVKGEFQNYLKAYGRTNQACVQCNHPLIREKIGGRSTHYCPKCQL